MAEGGKKVTVAVTSCNKEKLEAVDSAFASDLQRSITKRPYFYVHLVLTRRGLVEHFLW